MRAVFPLGNLPCIQVPNRAPQLNITRGKIHVFKSIAHSPLPSKLSRGNVHKKVLRIHFYRLLFDHATWSVSSGVSLFAVDSYKRGTLCGERNESPSFSKGHPFSPNVARLSKLLTVGSIYRSPLKAPSAEQFHCNGFLCRTLVEKHPILRVNFSRPRLSHICLTFPGRFPCAR